MNLKQRHQIWESDHDLLEKDYENLVIWWEKNKPCNCDSEENGIFCKHFDKIVNATLSQRVNKLWDERLQIGIKTIDEVMRN